MTNFADVIRRTAAQLRGQEREQLADIADILVGAGKMTTGAYRRLSDRLAVGLMSIRYIRQGLKVVRVVDATEPLLGAPDAAVQAVGLEHAAGFLHAVAAGLRADAKRRRGWRFSETGGAPPAPDRDVTGAQLRAARMAAGLSQRDLAEAFPYGRGLIASVELGYRSCPPDLGAWAKQVLRTVPGGGKG